jgi:hypothetical protein
MCRTTCGICTGCELGQDVPVIATTLSCFAPSRVWPSQQFGKVITSRTDESHALGTAAGPADYLHALRRAGALIARDHGQPGWDGLHGTLRTLGCAPIDEGRLRDQRGPTLRNDRGPVRRGVGGGRALGLAADQFCRHGRRGGCDVAEEVVLHRLTGHPWHQNGIIRGGLGAKTGIREDARPSGGEACCVDRWARVGVRPARCPCRARQRSRGARPDASRDGVCRQGRCTRDDQCDDNDSRDQPRSTRAHGRCDRVAHRREGGRSRVRIGHDAQTTA